MAALNEFMAKQNQTMGSISWNLTNFKKMDEANVTRPVVQFKIASLKETFAQCRGLDAKIVLHSEGKIAETLPYIQDNQFLTCEKVYEEALDCMSAVLAQLSAADGVENHNVSGLSDFSSRPAQPLPWINLSIFNGFSDHWKSFRDRFQSLIIDNRRLTNVDRMYYLCSSLSSANTVFKSTILLVTARIRVYSSHGRFAYARALLDQSSVATLISSNLAQCLHLAKMKRITRVSGIGESQSVSHHTVDIRVTPASQDAPAYSTLAYVLKSLSTYVPHRVNSSGRAMHTADLTLAENDPLSSDPIELIIGADLFGQLILDGVRKGAAAEPVTQHTTLSWILTYPIVGSSSSDRVSVAVRHETVLENLALHLRRFWKAEELPQKITWSPEEQQSEEHFIATHNHTAEGRYIVRLPFKNGLPINIGESRSAALLSLYRVERCLQREPIHATLYRHFLEEYENLGHMAKILDRECNTSQVYYIPHHAVCRDSSLTTQLRVVFNASCRASNDTSLNDHLLVGPKLQTNLVTISLLVATA